jgi:glycosyltransferase involved in cell wall biosynthesis
MTTSIIIPCYNEAASLGKVLGELAALELSVGFQQPEFILVNDGSDDGSLAIMQDFVQENKNWKLLRHPHNRGKGFALRSGMTVATAELLLLFDADDELPVADIPRLLEVMRLQDCDFVNGSRYLGGRNRRPFWFFLANTFFSALTSLLCRQKVTDVNCGIKLFRQEVYARLQLRENRFGIESELLIKALKQADIRFAEVAVGYNPRGNKLGKKIRLLDGFQILWALMRYGVFAKKKQTAAY